MTTGAYINIAHGWENTRVFRNTGTGEFFCCTATRTELKNFLDKGARKTAEHIMAMVEGAEGEANLTLGYPATWSRRKRDKVRKLLRRGITDFDVEHLLPWLCLLL